MHGNSHHAIMCADRRITKNTNVQVMRCLIFPVFLYRTKNRRLNRGRRISYAKLPPYHGSMAINYHIRSVRQWRLKVPKVYQCGTL